LIADHLIGARLAVLIGGIIIACGHFTMVFNSLTNFYLGMALIAAGTGLLKPNISAMVGGLYRENDPRRDSGFSIFYMGINIGAVLAPLVCGTLAQGDGFKHFLTSMGFDPRTSWHWGFGAAGVGMTLGLVIFLLNSGRLARVGQRVKQRTTAKQDAVAAPPLTAATGSVLRHLHLLSLHDLSGQRWPGREPNLFAKELVRTEVFGCALRRIYSRSLHL
jgi:POT family proton-dependent oligopeptide transporter